MHQLFVTTPALTLIKNPPLALDVALPARKHSSRCICLYRVASLRPLLCPLAHRYHEGLHNFRRLVDIIKHMAATSSRTRRIRSHACSSRSLCYVAYQSHTNTQSSSARVAAACRQAQNEVEFTMGTYETNALCTRVGQTRHTISTPIHRRASEYYIYTQRKRGHANRVC